MKRSFLVVVALVSISGFVEAQNYTSAANGAWTTAANWTGGGGSPPLTHTWGTINVNHNMTINSAASFGGAGFNLASGKTISSTANVTFSNGTNTINGTINVAGNFTVSNGTTNIYGVVTATGNLSLSGGATVNVYGTLEISGNTTLNANLRIHPGGKVIVHGSVTVVSSDYLTIGTGTAPPPYGDMVIHQNLIQQGGDVTVRRNGRIAVFGNVADNGSGGTFIKIENGGQAYVHGNVAYSGGGSFIQNSNSTSPYGLYVNGTTTSSGGGGSVTSNLGDEVTMQNTNSAFYGWVANIPGSPLPIELLYFKVQESSLTGILLNWVTTLEKNFSHFEIQRAGTDLHFQSIARLDGKGGRDINTAYQFLDTHPLRGKNYYRLKSIDRDESFEYSEVIYSNWNFEKPAVAYPNPIVGNSFTLEYNADGDMPSRLQILDTHGNLIMSGMVKGATEIELPSGVPSGIYFVRIISVGDSEIIKVVIP